MSLLLLRILLIVSILSFSFHTTAKETEDIKTIADRMKFQSALQFYKIRKYDKALLELNEYLEIFINGIHRKDAYSHIAQIYFNRFDYLKSIGSYSSLYEEFPNSDEGIEAYFKIGICYQKMGYDSKSREIFTTILEDHPNLNIAYRAKIQLDLIEILSK